MPEVIFNGSDGRLEGRYVPGHGAAPPLAIVLHPHPLHGGTMNNRLVYMMFQVFARRGFATLRYNSRGVGRSQGVFDHGQGELRDAAAALDWMQIHHPNSTSCWVAGFSFGAWIAMQLLMRRPEIQGFMCLSLPANMYDFSFLAPCPASGLIVHGEKDVVTPTDSVTRLVTKLSQQRGITIDFHEIEGADHHFSGKVDQVEAICEAYLDRRLKPAGESLALAR
jgi:alpha/beta superfamily hydrolase